jgi:hypothetical protein
MISLEISLEQLADETRIEYADLEYMLKPENQPLHDNVKALFYFYFLSKTGEYEL